MKKNKTIAYMMAATLLIGGTFAGTKAWFTDEHTASNALVVTTGKFDLEVKENAKVTEGQNGAEDTVVDGESGWKISSTEEDGGNAAHESTITDNNTTFKNVRPGDKFEKTYVIKNTGTLKQKIKATGNVTAENDLVEVIVTYNGLNNDEGVVLEPGKTKTMTITVTPNANSLVSNDYENKNIIKFDGDDKITIKAIQENGKNWI